MAKRKIDTDLQKHQEAERADEELQDETSPLGSMPEEPEDIDKLRKSMGLPTDENGPKELDTEKDLEEGDEENR